jgi:hypothetical protein
MSVAPTIRYESMCCVGRPMPSAINYCKPGLSLVHPAVDALAVEVVEADVALLLIRRPIHPPSTGMMRRRAPPDAVLVAVDVAPAEDAALVRRRLPVQRPKVRSR